MMVPGDAASRELLPLHRACHQRPCAGFARRSKWTSELHK